MDLIKDPPDPESAWTLNHHTAASGHNFQAFLLEKSKSLAPATIVQLQKMLTKRYCAAATVNISCCFKQGEIRSAMNIKKMSKEQIARLQIRQKESTRRAMDILMKYGGQAAVRQHDVFQAATLHSGSASMKASHVPQSEKNRSSVNMIKKKEHLISSLQNSAQKQHRLKSGVYDDDDDDDDGFYIEKQLLLVPREKAKSMKRLQFKIKAAQEDNKEDFNVRIITKQAELRRPEGERQTQRSHTNIENGNQKKIAFILQAAHKTEINDVDHKHVLTEVGEEVLIMFFPPDTKRKTHKVLPSSEIKLILHADTGWETGNIPMKESGEPPSMTKLTKTTFFIETKSLKESLFSLKMHAPLDRADSMDIKPAEITAKVNTESVYTEQIKSTQGRTETYNTTRKIMGINHTKQEDSVPSEESLIPLPPSFKMTERETAKTEHIAETTIANMEIKGTTSSTEAFNQGGTQKADRPPSRETPRTTTSPEFEPRFIKWETGTIQATTESSFSGLRMRQDIPSDTTKLHEGTEKTAVTERKEVQNDPIVDSFPFAKPLEPIYKQATDTLPKTTDDDMPICGGLIHRTAAGWKHCMERAARMRSKMFSSKEPTDAFKRTGEQETERISIRDQKDNLLNDEEHDHFYYFDGVLRRVQNNFYPYYKRQRLEKRSPEDTENSVFTVRNKRENLLSYIRRLTLRNKADHPKPPGPEDDVQRE
ncbi:uncharacterized protein LOC116704222 [Etheostoma spectabile]|uniref:uncharacterized protein LOC116704222 n=1 Tax=Etheostoma spectabile TaxID=54343 RepID=UPI0013AE8BB6|nr:uncharacterized protein LOC116704222 [Etheostoma spectabile]